MNSKPNPEDEDRDEAEARSRRLDRATETYGLARVLVATQVAEGTYWRARGGGKLFRGTALSIDVGLDALEKEAP